jgi:small subunit ribosomal protein S16
MQVIRLARGGRNKYPTYRIVAAESARAATGKFIEVLGHYNPHTKELTIKKEETMKRIGYGAQPSNSVIKLLQREKMELPEWVKLKTKAPRKTEEPEAVKPAEKAEAESAESVEAEEAAPAEEVRVAAAATENAIETEANETPAGKTETAEDTEAQAEAAAEGEQS